MAGLAPIGEMRTAIPLGLAVYKLPPEAAYFWAVSGNIVSTAIAIYIIPLAVKFLTNKWAALDRFFSYIFTRTRGKYNDALEKWGSLALVVFIAIPLPMTGAWTGALIAFLFGISFWRAFFLISSGVAFGGILVLGVSLGVLKLFF